MIQGATTVLRRVHLGFMRPKHDLMLEFKDGFYTKFVVLFFSVSLLVLKIGVRAIRL